MLQLPDLRLGALLAEGGEGRVFELIGSATGFPGPGETVAGEPERFVYKQFRQARPLGRLGCLVGYPAHLGSSEPGLQARVVSSSAWPRAAVVDQGPEVAVGTVVPRAPQRFWLAHRDGAVRLATLSYLTSDPDRIDVAYGLAMPPPGAAQRVAVVYALARLLEAWQAPGAMPSVAHGDLSAKNVLWSLRPAPAVYVLDCDGAALVPAEGEAQLGEGGPGPGALGQEAQAAPPLRATTPNWDDPAAGAQPAPGTGPDRYGLGLAFLRVVGAAHFPVQARQRAASQVSIDLELPRSWRKLPDMPELWELCERSLSLVNAADRPSPGEWAQHLEALLGVLGASALARAVGEAQGDAARAGTPALATLAAVGPARVRYTVGDVVVRPVLRHRPPSAWQLITARPPLAGAAGEASGAGGASLSMTPRQVARRVLHTWAAAHRAAARQVRSAGRRARGARRLAGMVVLDMAAACVGLFVVGMVVSPWIGL